MILKRKLFILIVFLCTAVSASAQKSPASESDLKKQAEKLFEKENYSEATPMYSQLLSLYPRDAVYNYRYGVCLLLSGQDKTGAATYLEAAAKVKTTDPDVYFYLGRSYMFTDHFNEAINAFNTFKKNALSSRQAVLQPDVYIHNCENADQLRKDRKNVVVLNKRKVSRNAFFASYDYSEASGKLLTTPDRFLTPLDKEKMPNPVMFMTKDGETIYYASYGKKGENGKDIYKIIKLPDGSWSIPVNLGMEINTAANEDFPYLDKDGRTLYFCSNGDKSIGGYDILKSVYDFNTGKWSAPVNVGVPINTVDDDIFFMPSTKGITAVYATAVDCDASKIEVRNVKLGDLVSNIAVISGKYFSQDQVTRRDARISVVRTRDNGIVTSVKTDRTGDYELIVPAGDEYMLIVEGGSYLPHAEIFSVPQHAGNAGLKQRISMNKTRDTEEMTMTNFFSPSMVDSSLVTMEKPSQVAKSAFDVKDTASSKMQPITFEGKTLFVAPPSVKSLEPKIIEPVAAEENVTARPKENSTGDLNTSAQHATAETDQQNDQAKDESTPDQPEETHPSDTPAGAEERIVSNKTSNSDLVKMAFEDAAAVREEAEVLEESAQEKKADAKSLDSISVVRLKQANDLLKGGDKEKAEELLKESKENVLEANQLNKEADSIQSVASERKAESETAFAEASRLMKDFKVDTNATAYHAVQGSKNKKEGAQGNAAKKADMNKNKIPASGEQEQLTELSHSEKAGKLTAEADRLSVASKEMKQKAESAKDKNRKTYYLNKSNEFTAQSEIRRKEAQKENEQAILAHEKPAEVPVAESLETPSAQGAQPVAQNPDTKNELSKSGKDLSDSSVALHTQETNVEENQAATGGTEAVKQEENKQVPVSQQAVADTKSGEQQAGTSDKTLSVSSAQNKPSEIKPSTEPAKENDKSGIASLEEKKLADGESPVATGEKTNVRKEENKEKGTASGGDKDLAVNSKTEQGINHTGETSGKNSSNVVPAEKVSPTVIPMNTDPLAREHYRQYTLQMAASKDAENLSKATEAKLFTPNTKEKRDSLEAKTSELNRQSILQWQSAQKELAQAKEIDPEIEKKAEAANKADIVASTGSAKAEEKQAENNSAPAPQGNISGEKQSATSPVTDEIAGAVEEVQLDTTKPEYPKYVAVKKDILSKQTETVDLFVKGMQLNKQAVSIMAEEMKLRDQAQVTTEKKAKNKLIERADSLAMEADIVTNHSKEMLSLAQKNTGKVKELSATADQLKSTLVLAPAANNLQAGAVTKESASKSDEGIVEKTNTKTDNSSVVDEKPDSVSSSTSNTIAAAEEKKELHQEPAQEAIQPQASQVSADTSMRESVPVNSATATTGNEIPRRNTATQPPIYPSAKPEGNEKLSTDQPGENSNMNAVAPVKTGQESKLIAELVISDTTTFAMGKVKTNTSVTPIPMDPQLPEGLVFKVQIGAFHKPLPANTFKNLTPLSGETTRPGWIRYCLGLFRTFEPANLLKKEVRGMGYKDAFVVAYYNGKRIPLFDAYALISKAGSDIKKTYAATSEKEFSQLAKFEIRKSKENSTPDSDTRAFYGTTDKNIEGLVEYAVQVGVYRSSVVPGALGPLLPLNTEQMNSGLYRFTTGRFENRASADSMKRVAIGAGVKDAFVVIYRGGMKATVAGPSQSRTANNRVPNTANGTANTSAAIAAPNQVKPSGISAGVVFKVQIGAFKENVPSGTVSAFLSIADKGISRETDVRGLNIFYAGEFKNYDDVVRARTEIVAKGIKDAFIVAFVNGKRTAVAEALKDLNGN